MLVGPSRDCHLPAGPRERVERTPVARHGKGDGVAVGEAHDDALRIVAALRREGGGDLQEVAVDWDVIDHHVEASIVQAAGFDGASDGDFLGKGRRRDKQRGQKRCAQGSADHLRISPR